MKNVVILCMTALALAGCVKPTTQGNQKNFLLSFYSVKNACQYLTNTRYAEGTSIPTPRREAAKIYVQSALGITDAELNLVSKGNIHVGMNIEAAKCSWNAFHKNSYGNSYNSSVQYSNRNATAYLYEDDRSGIVNAYYTL